MLPPIRFILTFLGTDESLLFEKPNLSTLCMRRFICLEFEYDPSLFDYCGLSGVSCVSGELRTIYWNSHSSIISIAHIDWMPPSVRYIYMTRMPVQTPLCMRCMPKDIKYFHVSHCEIISRVDLTTLPGGTEWLCLPNNHLTGEVDLMALPKSIQTIDLQNNNIESARVETSMLPKSLDYVCLHSFRQKVKLMYCQKCKKHEKVILTPVDLPLQNVDRYV